MLSDYHHADGGFDIEGYEMLKGLENIQTHEHREWIPVFENTQDMAALASQVREFLKSPRRSMGCWFGVTGCTRGERISRRRPVTSRFSNSSWKPWDDGR